MMRSVILVLGVTAALTLVISANAASHKSASKDTRASGAEAENGLYICAQNSDPDDWEAEFSNGPIVVPAGTVFDYGGHILAGNLQDPRDWAHSPPGGGWTGISAEETERRGRILAEDMTPGVPKGGVATTTQVTLTKSTPCAMANAEVVLSNNWGWSISPINGDKDLFYQTYGVIRRGALDTNFDDDSVPFNAAAALGELNASVRGKITKTLDLDTWSASQPPDEKPVEGEGNSECFGAPTRQDISCRALTEKLLLSLGRATKAEVIQAMKVEGRKIDGGLHFLSNYSSGERWGSGDVNFLFDDDGRVSVIFAMIDPPNMEGKPAEFIWNAKLLPAGCSDIPNTNMKHCN